jgi:ribosomal protein S14
MSGLSEDGLSKVKAMSRGRKLKACKRESPRGARSKHNDLCRSRGRAEGQSRRLVLSRGRVRTILVQRSILGAERLGRAHLKRVEAVSIIERVGESCLRSGYRGVPSSRGADERAGGRKRVERVGS